jgi:large repetitive protein
VGTAYAATLAATGGTGAYTWSLAAGVLPAGLSLDATTGAITGTPTVAGTSSFTVQVQDSASPAVTATKSLSVTVTVAALPLSVTTTTLSGGTVGTAYAATLAATGGTGAYTWSLASGVLPAGLSLNATTGAITGTPTAAGTSSFTVQVQDSASPAATATKSLSVTVASLALSVTTTTLPRGTVGTAYSTTLAATGGTGPYTWSRTSGSLPTGLSLSASTGAITGTPTVAGTSSFTVRVTDSASPAATATKSLSLTVALPLSVTTATLSGGTVGTAYSATLAATGGTGPYTWSLASGALPAGLSLNATTGALTGTPTATGTASFTVQVTDSASPAATATRSLSMTVLAATTSTGYRPPTANAAVTSNAGDNNGFETGAGNTYASDNSFAVDTNSGTGIGTSCTGTGKDKHVYQSFGFSVPTGVTIAGIEVRLDAKVDSTSGSPIMCVQLSWDGGTTWTTTPLSTSTLKTTNATYILGGAANTWGRTWSPTEFSNANFKVRIIDVSSSTLRDFSLDYVAVQVTYR